MEAAFYIAYLLSEPRKVSFSCSAFWQMVRDPVYCRKIFIPAWKDEEAHYVKATHEPLIPESLFEEVQDILMAEKEMYLKKLKKRRITPTWLFNLS